MKLTTSDKQLRKPLVWLEIDTKELLQNIKSWRNLVGATRMMAVVKANAYGLGAAESASYVEEYADAFGAVGIAEALKLREAGITKPIVNLGIYSPDDAVALIDSNITPTIFTDSSFRDFESKARQKRTTADAWIKIDTGLCRLGIPYQDGVQFIRNISRSSWVKIEAVYSTLTEDPKFDSEQLNRFIGLREECEKLGISVPIWSIASSAAICVSKDFTLDMVRVGLPMFGYYPSQEARDAKSIALEPVVSFKTRVACVKELEKDESACYRRAFVARERTRIAVLLPGYSYGLESRLASGGCVLINGERFPIVGITATNCFVDIGMNKNIQAGDEAVLFGKQGNSEILLEEVCRVVNQMPYEFLSRIPEKVTRVYV